MVAKFRTSFDLYKKSKIKNQKENLTFFESKTKIRLLRKINTKKTILNINKNNIQEKQFQMCFRITAKTKDRKTKARIKKMLDIKNQA